MKVMQTGGRDKREGYLSLTWPLSSRSAVNGEKGLNEVSACGATTNTSCCQRFGTGFALRGQPLLLGPRTMTYGLTRRRECPTRGRYAILGSLVLLTGCADEAGRWLERMDHARQVAGQDRLKHDSNAARVAASNERFWIRYRRCNAHADSVAPALTLEQKAARRDVDPNTRAHNECMAYTR